MKTAVIIEAEETIRYDIKRQVSKHLDIIISAMFSNCEDALSYIINKQPDIVFLDIQMPGMSGLELARLLTVLQSPPCIIFITSSCKYAIEAFDTPAIGYLIHPIAEKKLTNALNKVRHLIIRKKVKKTPAKICVLDHEKLIPLDKNEIVCVFSKDRSVYIRTKSNEFPATLTMKEFTSILSEPNFLCIHRKYIINLDEVLEIIPWLRGAYQVKMNDYKKAEIPVSRNRTSLFKTAIGLL
jgi:two-component system LytT family response regulator/two-component system response regulator LytT